MAAARVRGGCRGSARRGAGRCGRVGHGVTLGVTLGVTFAPIEELTPPVPCLPPAVPALDLGVGRSASGGRLAGVRFQAREHRAFHAAESAGFPAFASQLVTTSIKLNRMRERFPYCRKGLKAI